MRKGSYATGNKLREISSRDNVEKGRPRRNSSRTTAEEADEMERIWRGVRNQILLALLRETAVFRTD
jgi:hypothetical protein